MRNAHMFRLGTSLHKQALYTMFRLVIPTSLAIRKHYEIPGISWRRTCNSSISVNVAGKVGRGKADDSVTQWKTLVWRDNTTWNVYLCFVWLGLQTDSRLSSITVSETQFACSVSAHWMLQTTLFSQMPRPSLGPAPPLWGVPKALYRHKAAGKWSWPLTRWTDV